MHAFLREQKAVADRDRQLDLKYSLPRAREPLLARIVLLKDRGRNNFPIINQVFFLFSSFVCVTVLCRKAAVRTYVQCSQGRVEHARRERNKELKLFYFSGERRKRVEGGGGEEKLTSKWGKYIKKSGGLARAPGPKSGGETNFFICSFSWPPPPSFAKW